MSPPSLPCPRCHRNPELSIVLLGGLCSLVWGASVGSACAKWKVFVSLTWCEPRDLLNNYHQYRHGDEGRKSDSIQTYLGIAIWLFIQHKQHGQEWTWHRLTWHPFIPFDLRLLVVKSWQTRPFLGLVRSPSIAHPISPPSSFWSHSRPSCPSTSVFRQVVWHGI